LSPLKLLSPRGSGDYNGDNTSGGNGSSGDNDGDNDDEGRQWQLWLRLFTINSNKKTKLKNNSKELS